MLAAIDTPVVDRVLDIGTGTGRVLELFADRTIRGVGIDSSRQMLSVARARLDDDRLSHCSVRQSDIYDLDLDETSYDVVVLHHVLHFLPDPLGAMEAAADVLRPGGTLLVVDFASHGLERLRTEHAHSHLGFDEAEVASWCTAVDLDSVTARHFPPPVDAEREALTVTLWTASKTATSSQSTHQLEASR